MTEQRNFAQELADALGWRESGEVEIDDTHRLVATIEHDPDSSINDFDCYGKFEGAYGYTDRPDVNGRSDRPDGFTGAARKIQVDRGAWVWWEPYREGHKVYDSPEEVRAVRTLLEEGFRGVVVKLEEMCDHGDWHSANEASLWGIDSLENGYLLTVLGELIAEVMEEA